MGLTVFCRIFSVPRNTAMGLNNVTVVTTLDIIKTLNILFSVLPRSFGGTNFIG